MVEKSFLLMKLNSIVFRSILFSLILSLGVIPALTGVTIAEEREIPESLKHLFACNETISLNNLIRTGTGSETSDEILISGKVNFVDGKAVNLGIQRGYPAIMWVYNVSPFLSDYKLVMSDGVITSEDDSFLFSIPEDKLREGKFVAYIFYGIPKESMQNSIMTGKIEFFNKISEEVFEELEQKRMKEIVGVDDIKRLQLEKQRISESSSLQKICYD